MASLSAFSGSVVSVSVVSLNLFEMQGGLLRRLTPNPVKAATLMSTIRGCRAYHHLFKLNMSNHGSFERFVRGNLSDDEVALIQSTIENQKRVFGRFTFTGLFNYDKFINKDSSACYCDPFSPEPKVYKGHVIFLDEDVNELMSAEKYDNMTETQRLKRFGDSGYSVKPYQELNLVQAATPTFEYGKLRFEIVEPGNQVLVKMYRRYTKKTMWAEKTFNLYTDEAMARFRTLMTHLISTDSIVVDVEVALSSRVWHSYDLEHLFPVLRSNRRMYYQDNKAEKVVVA